MATLIVYSGASSYHRCNCLGGFCYCSCASRSPGQYYPNNRMGNIFSGLFGHNHRDLDLNNLMIVALTHLTWIKTRSYWPGWVDGAAGLPVAVAGQGREARHGGSPGGQQLPNLSFRHLSIIAVLIATIIRAPTVGSCSICFLLMWQLTSWTTSSAATW